jgi:two-component system, OmpR family, phosphate regulon response regulator OmpR
MNPQDHILIVDDDREIRTLLGDYLQKHGYRTTAVADGKAMWSALDNARVDLIILDVMLPGDDGFVLCRNLQARGNWPVIMLTAKGEDTERIVGLELGADDYMPKPFNPRELLARRRAILRRTSTPAAANDVLRFGSLEIDRSQREVRLHGEPRPLTSHQFALLVALAERKGRVQSRDQLMEAVRGEPLELYDRSIDVHISRIRAAIEDDPSHPKRIKTVRAAGYVFVVPESE